MTEANLTNKLDTVVDLIRNADESVARMPQSIRVISLAFITAHGVMVISIANIIANRPGPSSDGLLAFWIFVVGCVVSLVMLICEVGAHHTLGHRSLLTAQQILENEVTEETLKAELSKAISAPTTRYDFVALFWSGIVSIILMIIGLIFSQNTLIDAL